MKSLHKYTVHTIAIAKDKSQPAVFDDEPIILFFVFVVNKLQIKVHQNLEGKQDRVNINLCHLVKK